MASGSTSSGWQSSKPGTQSPVTAVLQQLFGGNVKAAGGQFMPTSFNEGGVFSPQSFAALPGLLQNMPASGAESAVLGGGFQNAMLGSLLGSQGLLESGASQIPSLLSTDPTAQIAQARYDFSNSTLPAILERAPGFSSSDLQREATRAGTELGLGIAALREGERERVGNLLSAIPGYAQALGSNLGQGGADLLAFGQGGREFARDIGPAGDAFRVLEMLQSLTGPGTTNVSLGSQRSASGGVLS